MFVNLLAFSDISVKLRRVFYGRKPGGASVCLKKSTLTDTLAAASKSTLTDTLAAASGCQRRNDRSSYPPWKTPDGVYTQVPPAAGAGLRSKVCAGGGCVRNNFLIFRLLSFSCKSYVRR